MRLWLLLLLALSAMVVFLASAAEGRYFRTRTRNKKMYLNKRQSALQKRKDKKSRIDLSLFKKRGYIAPLSAKRRAEAADAERDEGPAR